MLAFHFMCSLHLLLLQQQHASWIHMPDCTLPLRAVSHTRYNTKWCDQKLGPIANAACVSPASQEQSLTRITRGRGGGMSISFWTLLESSSRAPMHKGHRLEEPKCRSTGKRKHTHIDTQGCIHKAGLDTKSEIGMKCKGLVILSQLARGQIPTTRFQGTHTSRDLISQAILPC